MDSGDKANGPNFDDLMKSLREVAKDTPPASAIIAHPKSQLVKALKKKKRFRHLFNRK